MDEPFIEKISETQLVLEESSDFQNNSLNNFFDQI